MKYKRILIIPLFVVLGILGSLQIPVLRTPLLQFLIDYALQGQGLSITFHNLSGIFPFSTVWGSITLSDAHGRCLDIKDLEISWSPWQWLQGEPTINSINARLLHWQRAPHIVSQHQQKKGLRLELPSVRVQEVILPQNQKLHDLNLSIALTAKLASLKGKVTFSGITVDGQAVFETITKAGSVQGTAKFTSLETVYFNLPYQWNDEHFHVKDAVIEGKGLYIQGEGKFSQEEQQGQLHFRIDQLKPWTDYFHLEIEGDGVTGTAILNEQKEVKGRMEAHHIAWREGVAVAAQADYHYSLSKEQLASLEISCQKIQWRDFLLTELASQIYQDTVGFHIKLQGADALTEGKLHLSALVDSQQMTIQEAFYHKGQKKVVLAEPLIWYYAEPWPRSAIHIKAEKGSLLIDPLRKTDKAQLTLHKFPLDIGSVFIESWPVQGILSGTGWLRPLASDFSYQFMVKGDNLHLTGDKGVLKTNLTMVLNGNKDLLQWKLATIGNPAFQLKSEGDLDWVGRTLNAQSKGNITLDTFSTFLGENSRMAGHMKIHLEVKGSIDQPLMNGGWEIRKGHYEDGDIGLILKDIEIQGQINNSLLTLAQVKAKDAAYGSVAGRGVISFQNGWIPTFDLKLELDKVTLAQTDEIKGLASGSVFLKGLGSNAKLFGTLDVLSLIYDFGDQKTVPRTLQIINEPDKARLESLNTKPQTAARLGWIPMNLVLNLKNPLVIRGEGLKSDWQGHVVLEGDLKNAYLVGHLQLVTGGFEFFGKKLKLIEGMIDFDKKAPNDPYIRLKAMREAMSIIIYFQITGRASNPAFSFLSVPPLPVEEIVARLLFDKSLGEMSSMQGMQLASALASLQTRSGLNVFNKLRHVFGLDVLEFKQVAPDPRQGQGQAQGAISLGKQVSEQVYLKAEHGLGADSSKVGVEIKVTPQLSIEADVGGAQNTGAGLNWSKRY